MSKLYPTREILPAIDIAVTGESRGFLEEMAEIAGKSQTLNVEKHFGVMSQSGFDIVNLRYKEPSVHIGLGGQLISHPAFFGRVRVEMRAEKWCPDPPTREVYCMAAKVLVSPILRSFNRSFNTRYRIRIDKPGTGIPRRSPLTNELFSRFAVLANKSSLHALDWRRFYQFVRVGRQELLEETLVPMLIAEGFSTALTHRLAEIYCHLWSFKRLVTNVRR